MTTLGQITDRLAGLLDSRPAADDVLGRAMREMAHRHAAHLQALGPVRVRALDPCPRCSGGVVASEAVAKCTRCGFTDAAVSS